MAISHLPRWVRGASGPVARRAGGVDPPGARQHPLEPGADLSPLSAVPDVESVVRTESGGCKVLLREGASPGAAIPRLATAVSPARIEIARPTLEEVFVKLVAA